MSEPHQEVVEELDDAYYPGHGRGDKHSTTKTATFTPTSVLFTHLYGEPGARD